jgi:PAS domain S-box-containing protein
MQPIFTKIIAPLLDALPDTIVLVDEGGRIVFASRAVKTLLGYEPPELVDQPVSVLVPTHSRDLHQQLMASFWQEPKSRAMTSRPFLHALFKKRRRGASYNLPGPRRLLWGTVLRCGAA